MPNKIISFFIISILLSGFSWAQSPVDTLSLSNAINEALASNRNLNISEKGFQIVQNNNTIGEAGFLPTIDASGSWNKSIQNTEQEFASGSSQSVDGALRTFYDANLDLNWTLFDGTKMFATRNRLSNESESAYYQWKSDIDQTIALVTSQYYGVALEQERLSLFESNIDFSTDRLQITKAKYEIGKGSKLTLLQAEVDLNADKSAMVRQRELLTASKYNLIQLLGRDDYADFNLGYVLTVDTTLQLEDILSSAMSQNPQLQAELIRQEVLHNELQEINRSFYPEVDFDLGYARSNLNSQAGFLLSNQTNGISYGFTARMNLFNGFQKRTDFQNAMIQKEIGELAFENIRSELTRSILSTYNTYKNNSYLQQIELENLDVAKENAEIALERFKLGVSNALELREAQVNAINAEIRYLTASFEAKQAEISLLLLSGQISSID